MKSVAVAFLLGIAATAPASAAYIVDTGTPTNEIPFAFDDFQYFAGQFSVGTNTTITGVEGWFWFGDVTDNSVTISLHQVDGNVPGATVYSASFDIVPNEYDWYGFASGLDWDVAAGTYWVSFVPEGPVNGAMPGFAPSPLSEYARGSYGTWDDSGPDAHDALALGIRISGHETVTDVPEPTAIGLIGLGILGVGAARRRRHS